jgi:hypothetical protein
MTDDPKKPFGVPPTSPVQPSQAQGDQPPAAQPPAAQPTPQQPGGFGAPAQPPQAAQPWIPASGQQPPQAAQPWVPASQQQQQPQPGQVGAGGFGGPPPGQQQGGFGLPGQPQPPGQAGFAPNFQSTGQPELPKGLKVTSIVLLILGSSLTTVGLVPCLGILNWIAFPLDLAMSIIGILGLTIGPKLGDGKPSNMNLHIAAIVVGVVLAAISFFRCLAGGFVA